MANTRIERTVHFADLPWNVDSLKRSDLVAIVLVVILAFLFSLVKLPPPPVKKINENFDRTVLIPPPLQEAPKEVPKPVETKKEEKAEKKEDKKVEEKPVEKAAPKQKLGEAKPIPAAAKPVNKAEETAAPQPDLAAIQAAKLDAARQKARAAVLDTGLGNAADDLLTIDPGTVTSDNLQLGGGAGSAIGKGKVGIDKTGIGAGGGNKAGKLGGGTGGNGTGIGSAASVGGRGAGGTGKEIRDTAVPTTRVVPKEEKATSGKRTDFDRVMSSAEGRIGKAHKRALDDDPTLTGNVRLRVKVSGDGRVTAASVIASDLGGHALEGNIMSIVKGLSFAGGFSDFEGTYTYSLTAQ